ncbi:MAG TPA: PASTA domain-containing protein [Bacteroidales bacterium]|nr:PASTA domain-containing protein [Bacteroidales bacterium]HSA44580.1 PASTA domain-containing protein [Bacteroidales bacterium]
MAAEKTFRYKWLKSAFVRHTLLAVLLSLVLLIVAGLLLKWYTKHGEVVVVPDLRGLYPEDLDHLPDLSNFRVVIIDSVFDPEKKKGSIAFQDPPPSSIVKESRTIYLTLVAILPEQVSMPKLTDMTLRQATAVLETYGLKVGHLDYIPDIGRNNVIRQRYKGKHIEAGTWIEKGSRIDLVVGQGAGSGGLKVPFLLGMKRNEAILVLENAFFVTGNEVFEDGKDTATARVYRQHPSPGQIINAQSGTTISLWYRSDKKFDFDTYLKQYKQDSIPRDADEQNQEDEI